MKNLFKMDDCDSTNNNVILTKTENNNLTSNITSYSTSNTKVTICNLKYCSYFDLDDMPECGYRMCARSDNPDI